MVPQAADLVSISAVLLFEGVRFCVSFAAASDTLLAKTTTAMKQFRFDLVLAPPSHTTLESNGLARQRRGAKQLLICGLEIET